MKEDFVMIHALVKRGVCQRDIATMLGVHPKTVGRALAYIENGECRLVSRNGRI